MNMSHYSSEYIDLAAILGIKRLVDEKLENDLSPLKNNYVDCHVWTPPLLSFLL